MSDPVTGAGVPCDPLSRRSFLQAAGAGALLSMVGLRARGQEFSMNRPNVVYILADDMGYGDLACQSPGSKIPTPNLDRLATQGLRFSDAHAPSSVCSPTRYGVLTGRYCWRTELQQSVLWPWDAPLIEPDRLTAPEMLRGQGYATACIGKWHLGWDWATKDGSRINDRIPIGVHNNELRTAYSDRIDFTEPVAGGPITRGFDCYFGDDVPNFPPYVFIENDRTVGIPSVPKPKEMFGADGPMLPGWELEAVMPEITRRAAGYIEDRAGRAEPFFLYFPLTAPHTPIVPTDEFKGRSGAGDYGDWVCEVDWSVGEIMAALDRTGLADDTILVFTSDNGPENSAYRRIREHRHYSMGDLRGLKRDTWEGGHRVPFLARWPGRIPAGRVSSEIICLTDLMATLADLLETELPNDAAEDSYSILPALLGEAIDRPIREATVHHASNGKLAIRQGEWVFIDAPTGNANRVEPDWFREERGVQPHSYPNELFNLSADLSETRNLYAEYPDQVRELKALLERYRREGRSVPAR